MEQLFIELNFQAVVFLLIVGFIGGLVCGFIGSGGAFVLTPGMMSLGVPGLVAVASNICHKFPKALVGAIKRHKFGQVDVKLGLAWRSPRRSAMWSGPNRRRAIKATYGEAGSNLYVSACVRHRPDHCRLFVLRDAHPHLPRRRHVRRRGDRGDSRAGSSRSRFPARWSTFSVAKTRVSFLFILPLGFATGLLASMIAVGGFVGVPGMMYVLGAPSMIASATELVIAFVMGLGGTIKYALQRLGGHPPRDDHPAGSLFGIQLGAIGTTFVQPLHDQGRDGDDHAHRRGQSRDRRAGVPRPARLHGTRCRNALDILKKVSFAVMIVALAAGALIIVGAMIRGHRQQALA